MARRRSRGGRGRGVEAAAVADDVAGVLMTASSYEAVKGQLSAGQTPVLTAFSPLSLLCFAYGRTELFLSSISPRAHLFRHAQCDS